jgi:hypothetical protein
MTMQVADGGFRIGKINHLVDMANSHQHDLDIMLWNIAKKTETTDVEVLSRRLHGDDSDLGYFFNSETSTTAYDSLKAIELLVSTMD